MNNAAQMLLALQAVEESAVILGGNEVVSKEAMALVRAAITAAAPEHACTGASLYLGAVAATSALEDWTHQNEAEFSGWGDMIVPAMATFWRIKAGQAVAALAECRSIAPVTGDSIETCPVCAEPLNDDDICATDITMGICHAACLEGSPTVDLETGDEMDGPMDTYRYGDTAPTEPKGGKE